MNGGISEYHVKYLGEFRPTGTHLQIPNWLNMRVGWFGNHRIAANYAAFFLSVAHDTCAASWLDMPQAEGRA